MTDEILASSKIDPNEFTDQGNVLLTNTAQIANAGYISFGTNPPTSYGDNEGVFIGYDNGPKVSFYSNYNNYFQWDGTKLLVRATNFTLDLNGNITANNADLSGKITATEGYIGGWTIEQDRFYSDFLTLNSIIPAITMGATTNYLNGIGLFIGKNSDLFKMSIGDPDGEYFAWDGEHLLTSGRWIGSTAVDPTLQEWKSDIVFSSVNATTVDWTGGFISLSDGITNYTITSGTTGVMSALTYVYLDVAVSLTALQVSTLFSDAVGDGKILVATAQNNTTGASVIPYTGQQPIIDGSQIIALSILAGQIAASSITADKLNVVSLSAITADMGNLNINGLLVLNGIDSAISIGTPTPPSANNVGTGIWIDETGFYGLNSNISQFAISSTTGAAIFGGGQGTIDNQGINLNGLRYGLRHYATDLNGENSRYGSFEMKIPEGGTIPSLALSYFDATSQPELGTNVGFEMGDFTGYTTVGGAFIDSNRPHSGTYCGLLRDSFTTLATKVSSLKSDAISVTSGDRYLFGLYRRLVMSIQSSGVITNTTFSLSIEWYNVSNVLISTSLLFTDSKHTGISIPNVYDYAFVNGSAMAPSSATTAKMYVTISSTGSALNLGDAASVYHYVDDLTFKQIPMYRDIHFGPDLYYFNGSTDTKLGAGPTWGVSVTDGQDKTADTAASFNQQCTTIKAGQDLRVTNVLWDLPYAGDYELWLMNTQAVTDTWAKLWSGTVSAGDEINMVLTNPLVIHGGSTVYLSVKKLSAAVKFGSKNVSSYKGTDIYISGHWYDGTANAGYTPGVKIIYQIGTWG